MLKPRFFALLAITLGAAASRLLPHPPNVTPIAAMALFGGCCFASQAAGFGVPLAAMLLSDLLLGYGYHPVLPFVYGSLVLTVGIGRWVRRRRSALTVGGAALTASIVFFVVTNLGVWVQGDLYPRTLEGLGRCYMAAIPFFRNTVVGDALYTATLFGGLALAQALSPSLREPVATAAARSRS